MDKKKKYDEAMNTVNKFYILSLTNCHGTRGIAQLDVLF